MSSKPINVETSLKKLNKKFDSLIEQILSRSQKITNDDTELFFQYRIKKVEPPSLANLFEVLVSILNENVDESLTNNLFSVAFTFHILEVPKQKSAIFEIKFIPTNHSTLQFIGKKFNKSEIKRVLSQYEITEKSHKFVFQLIEQGSTEFRKRISELCTLILLSTLQDRRSYKEIKKQFKKITTKSLFINRFNLKSSYLEKLRPLLRDHPLRGAYGNVLIETINNYNKKRTVDVQRQFHFCKLIKTLFYMGSQEILLLVDKVYKYLGDNHFAFCVQILLDEDTEDEIENWLLLAMKTYCESNLIKKRLILSYRSLIESKSSSEYNLQKNRNTASFFLGVVGRNFGKRFHFDRALIVERYYALGVQLRNYFLLNEMEVQLEICVKQQLFVSDTYLQAFLNYLNDSKGYAEKYKTGLQQLNSIPLSVNEKHCSFRHMLSKVNQQIDLLVKIKGEQNIEMRNIYIIRFLEEQNSFKIIQQHQTNRQSTITDSHKTMYTDASNCSTIQMNASHNETVNSSHVQTNEPNNILNDISNRETKDELLRAQEYILSLLKSEIDEDKDLDVTMLGDPDTLAMEASDDDETNACVQKYINHQQREFQPELDNCDEQSIILD